MINKAFIMVMFLSLAGGICSILFLVLERWIYRLTSARCMVWVNTAVLLMFILPFYRILAWWDESAYLFDTYEYIITVEDGNIMDQICQSSQNSTIVPHIIELWAVGVVVYLVISIASYCCFIKKVQRNHWLLENKTWLETWHSFGEQRGIQLIVSHLFSQPCTTVWFRQKYIIIPEKLIPMLKPREIALVLEHELIHIQRRDVPLKLLIVICNSLQWFHPLFYMVKHSLDHWIELACDERMTASFSIEKRKAYMNLLFQLLLQGCERRQHPCFAYFAGREKRTLKQRVYGIMRGKAKGGIRRTLVVISCIGMIVAWSSSLAKDADGAIYGLFSDRVDIMRAEDVTFVEGRYTFVEEPLEYHEFSSDGFLEKVQEGEGLPLIRTEGAEYNTVFSDGQIQTVEVAAGETEHIHTLQTATIKEHIKYAEGSCKTVYYDGAMCTECGSIWWQSSFQTETHTNCHHNQKTPMELIKLLQSVSVDDIIGYS